MSLLLCILKVNRLSPWLMFLLSSGMLGICPWLSDLGQLPPHPMAPSELWWQHPYPCHQSDTVRPASINIWGRQIFLDWIIYNAWLETVSWVVDLVACMFVLDLYNKTWPNLIRSVVPQSLFGVYMTEWMCVYERCIRSALIVCFYFFCLSVCCFCKSLSSLLNMLAYKSIRTLLLTYNCYIFKVSVNQANSAPVCLYLFV